MFGGSQADEPRGLEKLLTDEQWARIRNGRVVLEPWSDGTFVAQDQQGGLAHGATPRLAIEALPA